MPSSVDAPPAGAAYVPSPRKNVVVLFGHFGTKPCAVAEAFAVVMSVRESPPSGNPVALVSVADEGVPSAPPETRFPDAVPVNAPVKVVAPTVVKVAAPGVPPPIVPGAANVAPPSVAALTSVILVPTPAEGVPKSPPA